MSEKMSS